MNYLSLFIEVIIKYFLSVYDYHNFLKTAAMEEFELLKKIAGAGARPLTDPDGIPVELPASGSFVGRLRIDSILGYGGIGVVYHATDPATEAVRAIKIPYPGTSPREIDRFRDEAKICAHLDHPNIVKVYAVALYRDVLPYAEMEFVDGMNVQRHISEKPLPEPVALSIIVLLCRALEYAYAQTFTIDGSTLRKMVHRDIKPANILISSSGVVKLADFGLAKFEGVDLHTITGAMPGTVPYMAPEQHQSPVASVRTDIYSTGVTLYEMVTGKRPFPEKGQDAFAQLITAKNNCSYIPARQVDRTLHPQTDTVIRRCLQPESGKRYPGYAALRMAIESVLGDYATIDAAEIVALYCGNRKHYRMAVGNVRRRFPKRLFAAAGVVFTAAAAAFFLYHSVTGPRKEMSAPIPETAHAKSDTLLRQNEPSTVAPLPDSGTGRRASGISQIHGAEKEKPGHRDVRSAKEKKGDDSRTSVERAETASRSGSPLGAAIAARREKKYSGVIGLLGPLSLDTMVTVQRDSTVLLLTEAYYRSGQINEGLVYGTEHPVNDCAYHLLMALLFDVAELPREAEVHYNRAIAAPCRLDPAAHDKGYLYRARFFQKVYARTADARDREKMVAAWREFIRNCCSKNSPECDDARRIVGGG